MKEGDTSLSAVVNSLFIPMSRKRVKDLGMKDEEDNRYVARLSREVDAAGKDNSVATGGSCTDDFTSSTHFYQLALHTTQP